jgi:hypothetical protein
VEGEEGWQESPPPVTLSPPGERGKQEVSITWCVALAGSTPGSRRELLPSEVGYVERSRELRLLATSKTLHLRLLYFLRALERTEKKSVKAGTQHSWVENAEAFPDSNRIEHFSARRRR